MGEVVVDPGKDNFIRCGSGNITNVPDGQHRAPNPRFYRCTCAHLAPNWATVVRVLQSYGDKE